MPAQPTPQLELVRFEIDTLDDQILELLLARFRRTKRIAQIKFEAGLESFDPEREKVIAARLARKLDQLGVDAETRSDVLPVLSVMAECGRSHVQRKMREAACSARHDGGDDQTQPIRKLDSGT